MALDAQVGPEMYSVTVCGSVKASRIQLDSIHVEKVSGCRG